MFRRAAASIILLIGCGGSHSDAEEAYVIRVSAVAGLSELLPGLEVSGSSAAAMDLVYDEPDLHIESMRVEGSSVILTRRASTRFSSEELAKALRSKELVSASSLDPGHIAARFRDEKTATLVAQYEALGFDLGPFQLESQDDDRVRLVRRGDGQPDVIELIEASRADEWRKLLGHELDVIPWASSVYRRQFSGVDSIRVLEIPARDAAALYFNVRSPQLADPAVRRRISSALNREAIAKLVCGDPSCALAAVEGNGDTRLPDKLVLLVPVDDTALRNAAKILRHQLWRLELEIEVDPVPVSDLLARATRGDFHLALAPLSMADHRFGFFLSPDHPRAIPVTGFATEEYDAAVDRGDLAAAQVILDRELPVTPLFKLTAFAAIDETICGDVTPSNWSLRWLSELYPCEGGEP